MPSALASCQVALDGPLQLGIFHVLFELGPVDPDRARDLEDLVTVELAAEFHQRVVERRVLALLDRSQGGDGGDLRGLAQDRQVLVDGLDLAVGGDHRLHRLVGALAVGALVVVEVDDDDVAVRIAADRAVGVAEQFGLVLLDALLRDGVALAVLLALELLHRLDQHFGVGEQVFANGLAERRLVGRNVGRCGGQSARLDGADGEEGAGGEQAGADDEKDGTHCADLQSYRLLPGRVLI